MSAEITAAVIAFAGAVLTVATTVFFSTRVATKHLKWNLKRQEYNLLISALAGISFLPDGDPEKAKSQRLSIEAKGGVFLQGSDEVVEALANYSVHTSFETEADYADFCRLFETMRIDLGNEPNPNLARLIKKIWGLPDANATP
jgi:hypothetical protein